MNKKKYPSFPVWCVTEEYNQGQSGHSLQILIMGIAWRTLSPDMVLKLKMEYEKKYSGQESNVP